MLRCRLETAVYKVVGRVARLCFYIVRALVVGLSMFVCANAADRALLIVVGLVCGDRLLDEHAYE
jgi:hypothetical protein